MKPILRNICFTSIGLVFGVLITWFTYRNYLNSFAHNSWLERVASDTDMLHLLREKSYDKAIDELESSLSIHLLLLASDNKSLDSASKKEVRLLKLTARERSLNPFRTGDQDIDPQVERLLADVLKNSE